MSQEFDGQDGDEGTEFEKASVRDLRARVNDLEQRVEELEDLCRMAAERLREEREAAEQNSEQDSPGETITGP